MLASCLIFQRISRNAPSSHLWPTMISVGLGRRRTMMLNETVSAFPMLLMAQTRASFCKPWTTIFLFGLEGYVSLAVHAERFVENLRKRVRYSVKEEDKSRRQVELRKCNSVWRLESMWKW